MSDMDGILGHLEHLIDDLDQIPRLGFQKYRSYAPEHLVEHDARAAANCTYCHIVAEAERRFFNKAGIVPLQINGLKVWLVADKAVIRWKKHDEDGRSRNYPTKQTRAFDRGDPIPDLPPPATRLSVGYFLDPTATKILRVQIAKPVGRRIGWCAAIVPAGAPGTAGKRWVDVTRQQWFP